MEAPAHTSDAAARLCIDFGTSYSKAAAYLGGHGIAREATHALAIGAAAGAENALLTPSVMFVDQGRILFGPAALNRARAQIGAGRDPLLSFKTILAAHDLAAVLMLKVRPSIDPTGTLTHADAFILYLAHLDQLIRIAVARDDKLPPSMVQAPRRFTTPIWRARGQADAQMATLFDRAHAVSQRLGAMLVAPDGASIAQCKDALDQAARLASPGHLEAPVFEAHAAGAAYAAFARAPKRFSLVIDMGAGTTDIAGFERLEGDPPVLAEIVGARQCCGLAGDAVDDIIVNLLCERAKEKSREQQEALWRGLRLNARALKRTLFAHGRCQAPHRGRKLTLKRDDLLASPAFRDFLRALAGACEASLRAMAEHVRRQGGAKIDVLLAGGGAHLPFLTELAQSAGAKAAKDLDLVVERFGDDWYLPNGFDPYQSEAFAQIAIALGGALAVLTDAAPAPALAET